MPSATEFRRAVNKAYDMRLRYSPATPEFDPFLPISVSENMRVCKFSTFARLCGDSGLPVPLVPGQAGFTVIRTTPRGAQYVIVYNDAQPLTRQRFTLAHELGHIVLGHTDDSPEDDALADCFARNLLTPALYAKLLAIPARCYPEVFRVSAAAARAAERNFDSDLGAVWPGTLRRVTAALASAVGHNV